MPRKRARVRDETPNTAVKVKELSIRLSWPMFTRIQDEAERLDESASTVIRLALRRYFAEKTVDVMTEPVTLSTEGDVQNG